MGTILRRVGTGLIGMGRRYARSSNSRRQWVLWMNRVYFSRSLCTSPRAFLLYSDSHYYHSVSGQVSDPPKLYPFDHLSDNSDASLPRAILYASPTDEGFTELFAVLRRLSTTSAADSSPARLRFALRWKPENTSKQSKLVLSGYGAGLDIKKTDYLVIDDRTTGTKVFDSSVEAGRSKIVPVKQSDMSGESVVLIASSGAR